MRTMRRHAGLPWSRWRRPAGITGLSCAALIGACSVGPNFSRPTPPAAAGYTAEPTRSDAVPTESPQQHVTLGRDIEGDWWSLFRSDAIDSVVKQAVAHNRTLEASAATLQQAQEIARAQAGTRYPQVGLTAGAGRQKYGDEFLGGYFNLPPFTYYAVGATVSYTLDYTGGVARGVEQQYAMAEVARRRLDAAYLTVTGQAVMQTLAIASARAQIATLDTLLAQDRENLKLVQKAFDDGSVARIDVVSAQSQTANDTALLPPLRQELARAHHASVCGILGRVPADELPPDVDLDRINLPLDLPVSLPSELARRRPDILAAEARLHAATSAVGVAESNLYPKIQLGATLGQQAVHTGQLFDSADTAWSLISGLTAPIFDGGTLRAEKRAAVDAMHASAADYEQTLLEAFQPSGRHARYTGPRCRTASRTRKSRHNRRHKAGSISPARAMRKAIPGSSRFWTQSVRINRRVSAM